MYDVIVVGARCAGSPTAMLLARKGYRVLLVDKTTFPRDTISTHYIHQLSIARMKKWGVLDQVIATLPLRYQKVIKLYYDHDRTMKQIGGVLGVNESRVSQIHKTALEKLAVALRSNGFESTQMFFDDI